MASLEILRMGNPLLASPAQAVTDPTDGMVRDLVADLGDTLSSAGGVGLAAPQVGVPWRMFVYKVPAARSDDGREVPLRALINPEIEPLGEDVDVAFEGCLSVPGLTGAVPRWRRIAYRAQDVDGRSLEGEATGFHARVIQHEFDHLLGRLYLSRMPDLSTLAYVEEMEKLVRALAAREKEKAHAADQG